MGATESYKLNLSIGPEPPVGTWPFPSDFWESPGACLALANCWYETSRSQATSSEGQMGDKCACVRWS